MGEKLNIAIGDRVQVVPLYLERDAGWQVDVEKEDMPWAGTVMPFPDLASKSSDDFVNIMPDGVIAEAGPFPTTRHPRLIPHAPLARWVEGPPREWRLRASVVESLGAPDTENSQ